MLPLSSDLEPGQGDDRSATVTLTIPGIESISFTCAHGLNIPTAARASGYRPRVVCARGGCGACRAVVIEGSVEHRGAISRRKLEGPTSDHPGYVLMCRAYPLEDVVLQPIRPWTSAPLQSMSNTVQRQTKQLDRKKGA